MRAFLIIISVLIFITGCNIALFVSKDDIIRREQGYILIDSYNKNVEFIPSKIDTSLLLSENLKKYKLGKAFYLYGIFSKELNYLKMFGDTIFQSSILVPVEFEYRQKREINSQIRKQQKEYQEHFIKVDDKNYSYKINIKNVYYINAYPLLSEEKERQKTRSNED
jgi:hypothetical protein